MRRVTSPLPIPGDHNPFSFYSHRKEEVEKEAGSRWERTKSWGRTNGKLFLVKPVLVREGCL